MKYDEEILNAIYDRLVFGEGYLSIDEEGYIKHIPFLEYNNLTLACDCEKE